MYTTTGRENLAPNSLDEYETVSGSVRHWRRKMKGDGGTRSTKSDTKFDSGIFWNHNVSEFARIRQGVGEGEKESVPYVHPPNPSSLSSSLSLLTTERRIDRSRGGGTRGCVDALWVIEAHQSAWQLTYWIQNAIFQVSTFRPPSSSRWRVKENRQSLACGGGGGACVRSNLREDFEMLMEIELSFHLSARDRISPSRVTLFHAWGSHLRRRCRAQDTIRARIMGWVCRENEFIHAIHRSLLLRRYFL